MRLEGLGIIVLGCQSLSAISASSMYEANWALYTAINVKTFNRDGPVSSGDVAGTNSGAFLFF